MRLKSSYSHSSFAYKIYWPVQIIHYSKDKTKFIYKHEEEPSVKAFLEETSASESAKDSEALVANMMTFNNSMTSVILFL